MKRSYRILLLLTLSGTGELILGACMRFLEMAGANILMVAGLISQVSALGYAGYLSLQRRALKAEV
ncbi:MAG: hypothetical protein HWE14_00330 [Flavobacteriia bacterium]|nr:hypothetical protein [Flavobacteriia bacterium]